MKRLLSGTVVTMVVTIMGAIACGGGDVRQETPAAPASPTPRSVAWLHRETPPVELSIATVGADEAAAWVTLDPRTGEYQRRAPIGGQIPEALTTNGRYAVVSGPAGLAVVDTAAQTFQDIGPGWTGEVSPDGRWAAIIPAVEGQTMAVIDAQTGERFDLGNLGKPVHFAWSADGRLAIAKESVLYFAEAPDWQARRVGDWPGGEPAWSPDGAWIAYSDQSGVRIVRPDLSEGRLVAKMSGWALAWAPDGQRLAYAASDGLYVAAIAGGEATTALPAADWEGLAPFWSPDGSAIASFAASREQSISGIVVAKSDGGGAYQITSGSASVIGWTEQGIIALLARL